MCRLGATRRAVVCQFSPAVSVAAWYSDAEKKEAEYALVGDKHGDGGGGCSSLAIAGAGVDGHADGGGGVGSHAAGGAVWERFLDGADCRDARLKWRLALASAVLEDSEAKRKVGLAAAEEVKKARQMDACGLDTAGMGRAAELAVGDLVAVNDMRSARHMPALIVDAHTRVCNQADYDSEVAKRAVVDLDKMKAQVRSLFLFEPGVSDRAGSGGGVKLWQLPTQAMPHRSTTQAARRELALLSAIPVDEDGEGYLPDHGWYMLGVQVGTDEWRRHLVERQQARHMGSLRAFWHRTDDWFAQGLNLTASVVVDRDLARERRLRKRQAEVGQLPPRHIPPPELTGEHDIYFLEAFAGSAPLSRGFRRWMDAMAREAALEAEEGEDFGDEDREEGGGQDEGAGGDMDEGDGGADAVGDEGRNGGEGVDAGGAGSAKERVRSQGLEGTSGAASSSEQVVVQALDWTGTVGHSLGKLPMSKGQMQQLGHDNFTAEDWLNTSCDPAHMPETIRLSPPRQVRRLHAQSLLHIPAFLFTRERLVYPICLRHFG
jgi:hypothetical protein